MIFFNNRMGDTGLEPSSNSPEKTANPQTGAAESGAVGARNGLVDDPRLAEIVVAWPDLSVATKQAIFELAFPRV